MGDHHLYIPDTDLKLPIHVHILHMEFLRSPIPSIPLDTNIGQRLNIGNREIVILLVIGFQRTPYIVLGQCVLVLHHLQILKSQFHILPELLLRYAAFVGIDGKAHQKEIPMPALYLADLPQPPMVESIRIVPMHLSSNVPLLAPFLAIYDNTLIPLGYASLASARVILDGLKGLFTSTLFSGFA